MLKWRYLMLSILYCTCFSCFESGASRPREWCSVTANLENSYFLRITRSISSWENSCCWVFSQVLSFSGRRNVTFGNYFQYNNSVLFWNSLYYRVLSPGLDDDIAVDGSETAPPIHHWIGPRRYYTLTLAHSHSTLHHSHKPHKHQEHDGTMATPGTITPSSITPPTVGRWPPNLFLISPSCRYALTNASAAPAPLLPFPHRHTHSLFPPLATSSNSWWSHFTSDLHQTTSHCFRIIRGSKSYVLVRKSKGRSLEKFWKPP
jgi:hypothetical protein